MENHYSLDDNLFEKQFEDLSLIPTLFNHEAHLRLAWIHIKKFGVDKAEENLCEQIKAFATFHGDNDKYNLTVTVAAVRAVYHFLLKSKSDDFQNFISEFPKLKDNFKLLIEGHYSIDIFNSELAKKEFIKPDLSPFDDINLPKDN